MMLDSILPDFLFFVTNYKYLLLFLGVIFEGPLLMIATGILVHVDFFSLTPAFWILVAGDLVADVIWYHIGYFFAEPFLKRFGKFLKITPEMFEGVKELFHKHHEKILLISKVTIGLGIALATLMAAGATRVSLRKFLMINFLGEVVLVGIMLSLGYFFGEIYDFIADTMKVYFIFGFMLSASLSFYFITKHVRKKLLGNI